MRAMPLILTCLPIALSACGGGGGGGFGGGGIGGAEAALGRVDPAYAVEPTLPDPSDEINDSLVGGAGASGIAARWRFLQPGASFVPIKMTLNVDRSILTLKVDGTEYVLPAVTTPSNIGGDYGIPLGSVGLGSTTPSVSLQHSFNDGLYAFTQSTGLTSVTYMKGRYGIETPLDRHPTSANYTGILNMTAIIEGFSAPVASGLDSDFDMTVDFAGNTISGTATGGLLVNTGSGLDRIELSGDIIGTETDGGLAATILFASDTDDLLSVTLAGRTYGWDAEDVGGAAIGTYIPTGDTLVGDWQRF